jgi:hypothetical protein
MGSPLLLFFKIILLYQTQGDISPIKRKAATSSEMLRKMYVSFLFKYYGEKRCYGNVPVKVSDTTMLGMEIKPVSKKILRRPIIYGALQLSFIMLSTGLLFLILVAGILNQVTVC